MTERKDAFYFPHDSNAHMDERILELRAEFGWEGYGIFWALIERMRDASDYRIGERSRRALALGLAIDPDLLDRLVDFCLEIGLFVTEEERFGSPALDRRMADVDARRKKLSAAGKKGGRARSKQVEASPKQDTEEVNEEGKPCLSDAKASLKPSQAGKERKGKKKEERESERDAREPGGGEVPPDDPDPPGGEELPEGWLPEHLPILEAWRRWKADSPMTSGMANTIRLLLRPRGMGVGAKLDGKTYAGYTSEEVAQAIEEMAMSSHHSPNSLIKHVAGEMKPAGGNHGKVTGAGTEAAGARAQTDYQRRREFASTPFDKDDYDRFAESLRGIRGGSDETPEDH